MPTPLRRRLARLHPTASGWRPAARTFAASVACAVACAAAPLPRSTQEAQGVEASGILAFLEAANRKIDTLHSFMLVRHGHVVAEGWWKPESPTTPHVLYSLSKSFTSTAVGLAVGEGRISIDDRVLTFFPEDAPAEPGLKGTVTNSGGADTVRSAAVARLVSFALCCPTTVP